MRRTRASEAELEAAVRVGRIAARRVAASRQRCAKHAAKLRIARIPIDDFAGELQIGATFTVAAYRRIGGRSRVAAAKAGSHPYRQRDLHPRKLPLLLM